MRCHVGDSRGTEREDDCWLGEQVGKSRARADQCSFHPPQTILSKEETHKGVSEEEKLLGKSCVPIPRGAHLQRDSLYRLEVLTGKVFPAHYIQCELPSQLRQENGYRRDPGLFTLGERN